METDRRGGGAGRGGARSGMGDFQVTRDYFVRPLLENMHESFSTLPSSLHDFVFLLFFLQHEFLLVPSYHFSNGASLTFTADRFSVLVSIKNHCKPRYMFSPLKSGLYLSVGVLRTICV